MQLHGRGVVQLPGVAFADFELEVGEDRVFASPSPRAAWSSRARSSATRPLRTTRDGARRSGQGVSACVTRSAPARRTVAAP